MPPASPPDPPINPKFWQLVSQISEPDLTVLAANLPGGCLIATLTDRNRNADPVYVHGSFHLGAGKFGNRDEMIAHKTADTLKQKLEERQRKEHESVAAAPFVPVEKVSSELPTIDPRDIEPAEKVTPIEAEIVNKDGST